MISVIFCVQEKKEWCHSYCNQLCWGVAAPRNCLSQIHHCKWSNRTVYTNICAVDLLSWVIIYASALFGFHFLIHRLNTENWTHITKLSSRWLITMINISREWGFAQKFLSLNLNRLSETVCNRPGIYFKQYSI